MFGVMLILFFGPDGSGKSTLSRKLYQALHDERRVLLSWMRGSHTMASLIARILSRIKAFKGIDNPYYNIKVPRSMRGLWAVIEFVSMLPILFFKYLLPHKFKYVVIGERSIPDFIAWVILTLNYPGYLKTLQAKFLLRILNTHFKIYVTASLNELVRRRNDMNRTILLKELVIYEFLYRVLNAHKLDTTGKSIEESLNEILSIVKCEVMRYE